jgi:hypothetical protein
VSEEKMAAGVLKSGLLPRYIFVPCRLKNTCRHIYTIQVCRRQRECAAVLWIRVRKDPRSPEPHQIKIRIRIKIYKLDPDPHQFADAKPKCMEYEPILAPFQGV